MASISQADKSAVALLGLPVRHYKTSFDVAAEIRSGLPFDSFERLARQLRDEVSRKQFVTFLGYSDRTADRVLATKQVLKELNADRLYRVARAYAIALHVFEDADRAKRWLFKPNRALAGNVPFELLDTSVGADEVESTLRRIEHGIFA